MARALWLAILHWCSLLAVLEVASLFGAAGSELNPEIADPADDVSPTPAYPPGSDTRHLDLLAIWWEYAEDVDALRLHAKGTDYGAFARPPPNDHNFRCWFTSSMILAGNMSGDLTASFGSPYSSAGYESAVTLDQIGASGSLEETPIAHGFRLISSEPGYLVFSIARQQLLHYGEALSNLTATCNDLFFPAGAEPNVAGLTVVGNPMAAVDRTSGSNGTIDLRAKRPVPPPETCEVEIDCPTPSTDATTPAAQGRTSSSPASLALIGIAGALPFMRRTSRT